MSWLLLAVLGIIWAAFLLPSWKRSPTSSVEEFERKMNLLAETHRRSPGRWVLMPRKGQRFVGFPDRQRMRVRRRRRQVLVVLLEATGLTFLMGLFPPLRGMLFGAGFLAAVVLTYCVVLMRLRVQEVALARRRARARRAALVSTAAYAVGDDVQRVAANGNGHPHALANGNGRRVGHGSGNGHRQEVFDEVAILDEDVHVVVRRPRKAARAGAR